MDKIPVKGHSELIRDSSTNAIINKDRDGYREYIANRERMNNDKERIQSLEKKVESISDDISDIKNMINLLIRKENG